MPQILNVVKWQSFFVFNLGPQTRTFHCRNEARLLGAAVCAKEAEIVCIITWAAAAAAATGHAAAAAWLAGS
jgi:hypothetical protein